MQIILFQILTLYVLLVNDHSQRNYLIMILVLTIILSLITSKQFKNESLKNSFELLLMTVYLQLISIAIYGTVLGNGIIVLITIAYIVLSFSFYHLYKLKEKIERQKIEIPNNFTQIEKDEINEYLHELISELNRENDKRNISDARLKKDFLEMIEKVKIKINEIKSRKNVD